MIEVVQWSVDVPRTCISDFPTMKKEIEEELSKIRLQGAVPPIQMQATEEQIKKGAPANYTIPITFDNSNFFV